MVVPLVSLMHRPTLPAVMVLTDVARTKNNWPHPSGYRQNRIMSHTLLDTKSRMMSHTQLDTKNRMMSHSLLDTKNRMMSHTMLDTDRI